MTKAARRRNDKLLKAIGNRFREIRKAKNLSQTTVYIDTEIHIARVEQGRYNITVSTLSDLCDYYGVPLRNFFNSLEISE